MTSTIIMMPTGIPGMEPMRFESRRPVGWNSMKSEFSGKAAQMQLRWHIKSAYVCICRAGSGRARLLHWHYTFLSPSFTGTESSVSVLPGRYVESKGLTAGWTETEFRSGPFAAVSGSGSFAAKTKAKLASLSVKKQSQFGSFTPILIIARRLLGLPPRKNINL